MSFEGRHALILVVVALPLASVACTIGETRYETVHVAAAQKSLNYTCDSPIIKPDLSTLKACGHNNQGHCYPKAKVQMDPSQLDPCEGEPDKACIPDLILNAAGKKLQSCTFSLGNKPGACMSTMPAQIQAHLAFLHPDGCTEKDTVCVPCIDPTTNTDTHMCADHIGVHQEDCVGGPGGSGAKLCCHDMGTCTDLSAIPPDSQSHMERETCPENKVCAPTAMITNKPVKCDLPLGLDGVCLDLCFASMFESTTQVTRSSCGPTEVCMPCLLGKSQGMPGCD